MKGMSFQNGVEFRITIDGESWSQGDLIKGKIESKPASEGQVLLAEGTDKKIKAKSADAFIILEDLAQRATPFEWSFQLSKDSRMNDKQGALYILYGRGDSIHQLGQLKLNILPHSHIRDLTELFINQYRFALKSIQSAKNGTVEIKLDPPGQKDWAMLEQLVIYLKLSHETMDARFSFHRNEVDAIQGGLSTKSVKREISKKWNLSQIVLSFNQRLDKEVMSAELEKLISEYRQAGWLSS